MVVLNGQVRIGEIWYRLAEGYFEQTGLRPMRVVWDSLFAPRQGSPGAPGYHNLREDDLRWVADSWRGGEGQEVIDPTDEDSFRRSAKMEAIDASSPGKLRLGRALVPEDLTGAGSTTRQGSAPDASSGGTDEGTDRRFTANGNWASYNLALSAGTWSIRMYAYEDPPVVLDLATFVEVIPHITYGAGTISFMNEGARTRSTNRTPGAAEVAVAFTITGPVGSGGTITCKVVRIDTDKVVAQRSLKLSAAPQPSSATLTYTAKAGITYRYFFTATELVTGRLELAEVTEDLRTPRQVDWEIRDPSDAVVSAGSFDTLDVTSSRRLATAQIQASTGGYKVRYMRTSAPRDVYIDRTVYEQIGLASPRVLELGLGSRVWLVDHSASAQPAIAYWSGDRWQVVGTFGSAGLRAIALAHSDKWEYIGASDGVVYRASTSLIQAGTSAISGTLVGCAVGANRLYILGETEAAGTKLYEHELDGTPGAPTERYAVGNVGVGPVDELPQRIAGTASGCVFITNSGPSSWLHAWDGQAGAPIKRLAAGFRATAVCHALGLTWVAGEFEQDAGGTKQRRPAIFVVDAEPTSPAEQLPVALHREGDSSSRIVALQQYGTDLWALARVAGDPPLLRIWRISLAGTPAAFCEHELAQPPGDPRGLAVGFRELFAAWSDGPPLRRASDHALVGRWTSSLYTFRLTEPKILLSVGVAGEFPAGTSALIYYSRDGGSPELAGLFTSPGEAPISVPGDTRTFRTLGISAELRTADVSLTPSVQMIDVRATTAQYRQQVELLLRCTDPDVAGIAGQRVDAADAVQHIFALAATGEMIEFEDRYSDPSTSHIYRATVAEADARYLGPGEALVRVLLRLYGP